MGLAAVCSSLSSLCLFSCCHKRPTPATCVASPAAFVLTQPALACCLLSDAAAAASQHSAPHPTNKQQSKVDALWLALAVMVLPAASYFAIHAAVLGQMLHFWSLLILGCAPLAYLSAVPDGLWWLPMSPRFIKGLSRLLLVLTSLGLLAGAVLRLDADDSGTAMAACGGVDRVMLSYALRSPVFLLIRLVQARFIICASQSPLGAVGPRLTPCCFARMHLRPCNISCL